MDPNFFMNKKIAKADILKFESIRISLASPEHIRQWAAGKLHKNSRNAKLSQVLNAKTLNYKTFKPEKGGLFCEQIFGSLNSPSRRYKLGYIELLSPLTHVWYLKG